MKKYDMSGRLPESWVCVDCGINTAPGCYNRERMEHALAADWNNQGVEQSIDDLSEVYMVKPKLWKAAGMNAGQGGFGDTDGDSGCLCIGCLEKRLGRTLVPKDFSRHYPCNRWPGTERLRARRGVDANKGRDEWPNGKRLRITRGV
jgi:hypothetical protein